LKDQNIELPPLPKGVKNSWDKSIGRAMQDYARQAIAQDRQQQADWHKIADKRAAEIVRLEEQINSLRQQRGEPVAVLRFDRTTPGLENEMPTVVSCNSLPDGEYPVYTAPQPAEPTIRNFRTVAEPVKVPSAQPASPDNCDAVNIAVFGE